MKHLKKIFESVYEEIDIETLKSFIEDFEDEFKISIPIVDIIFFNNKKHIPEYRNDWSELLENQYLAFASEGDDIYGYGYLLAIDTTPQTSHIDIFIKENDIITNILRIGKRINDNFDSVVFVSHIENELRLIIRKKNPNKDDYYKILMFELETYIPESSYSSISLENDDSDYFIVFNSAGTNPVIQKQYLKYFMENCFTKITYDELIIINNNSLKLKNPKCDFIKFKI